MLRPVLEKPIDRVDDLLSRGEKLILPVPPTKEPGKKFHTNVLHIFNQRAVKFAMSFKEFYFILLDGYKTPGTGFYFYKSKLRLNLFVDEIDGQDRIAIVTYAGNAGVALPSTSGDQKTTIKA